jgi:hypothetical protein
MHVSDDHMCESPPVLVMYMCPLNWLLSSSTLFCDMLLYRVFVV